MVGALTGEGAIDAFTVVCRSTRARRVSRDRGRFLPSGSRSVRVSVSSASRWSQRFAQQGHIAPRPTHGDDSLPAIEAHADLILSLDEARPELFLRELRDALAEQGVQTSTSGLSRFFAPHGITRKKGRCTRLSKSGLT